MRKINKVITQDRVNRLKNSKKVINTKEQITRNQKMPQKQTQTESFTKHLEDFFNNCKDMKISPVFVAVTNDKEKVKLWNDHFKKKLPDAKFYIEVVDKCDDKYLPHYYNILRRKLVKFPYIFFVDIDTLPQKKEIDLWNYYDLFLFYNGNNNNILCKTMLLKNTEQNSLFFELWERNVLKSSLKDSLLSSLSEAFDRNPNFLFIGMEKIILEDIVS